MLMMALLPPGGLLGGYGGDPDGVNGSWEKTCTSVSTPIRVRVASAAGEYAHHLLQRLFLALLLCVWPRLNLVETWRDTGHKALCPVSLSAPLCAHCAASRGAGDSAPSVATS